MRKQYTTEEKQNLVAMFKSGTQTTTAFAQANGIDVQKLALCKNRNHRFCKNKNSCQNYRKKYKNSERRN